ncbi:MAG: NAD-dependent dehydratase [Omnitrophica WOR_2 bacterium GWF2_43_52]|nr:MAG: NAD-dependent dehydratase [Omnitrophica WOR_2 bacterium GWA2_44_7]OGX15524.1 MAG: NAD-dependent dehydratase [Omnitrophica WOR_2 bacterium GWC2_44_8]OGX20211.1 MAG: NAD-dependent dehydratase [Omnitrophica WOR_2 bacterium GWF2_43_52]OGX54679.1 MAG: NAD-dependent dehydratase [Omnitrophica WOR_2 bacterium RIFOXYC2_FULL_43_9]HAH19989.1 NAD-dependent dehydratase [Candidatus Omnitrophota bacterium]
MKKTALVTGGAGFLGSYLCERLLGLGFKVICLDNLITGNIKNIETFRKDPRFEFIRHDVSKPIFIKSKIAFVLHFASPASPADYLNYPIQTLKVGSLGTHNALGVAKEKKARFLLASTSEVYGDPLVHPQTEEYWGNVNCIGPRGVYDEAKRFAEAITMAYHRVHKVDTRIVRIFNTYGPRMRKNDGRAIPNFISQALLHKPLTVYGKGRQTRSFCYVDDLIDGLIRLLMSSVASPVNIGNPNEMCLIDLAKLIVKFAQSKSKIHFKPLPVDDPKQRRPDITRARKYLKWQPKVSLAMGLTKTIAWYRTVMDT